MMPQNSFNAQNVVFFLFLCAPGMAIIGFCCADLYHWYLIGNLWVHPKYSNGWFTTYREAPSLFVVAFAKQLLLLAGGIVLVAFGIVGPGRFRKRQQARLAWREKYPPRPWPARISEKPNH